MANYITVGQLNNYLKRKVEADVHLGHVYLKGEISNSKLHSRGHLYFSLKDETSVIGAIMFAGDVKNLNFEPKEGTKVFAEGKVTVYEASGKYQIIVNSMQPDGIGALYIAYEKLKKELEKEGLFLKEHKKPIPKYPKKIGIVTAPTGAAIRDILSTIKRRYPICETILFPALVQGESAKYSIKEKIEEAQNYDLDVLIVGRGGGSIEDLWAFNEEIVARSIYASKIPVISAVGHEVDFTIADFVADLRAPTPTGAAEMAVPNMSDVISLLDNYKIRLNENINSNLNLSKKRLDSLRNSYILKNPMSIYEIEEQKLQGLIDRLSTNLKNLVDINKTRLENLKNSYALKNPMSFYEKDGEKIKNFETRLHSIAKTTLKNYEIKYKVALNKLELLNPLAVLKKGYSVVSKDNVNVKSIDDLKENDMINITLSSGNIDARVEKLYRKEN